MQAWILAGVRVDIELAVALEVGVSRLGRVESDRAVAFNRDLWRLVRNLAATAPEQQDRDGLASAAARLANGNRGDFDGPNRFYAGRLAGRAATTGTLRRLMDDWRVDLNASPNAMFGAWLLARLGRLAIAADSRLAA